MYRHVATHISNVPSRSYSYFHRMIFFFYGLNLTCSAAVRPTVDTRLTIILGFVEKNHIRKHKPAHFVFGTTVI